ncbi:hypothetical protein, partial [Plasmodium yoelii yoelii]
MHEISIENRQCSIVYIYYYAFNIFASCSINHYLFLSFIVL